MKKYQNRYELLANIIGVNIKSKFSAYGWWENADLKISKDDNWSGWWNECFNFISVFPKSNKGEKQIQKIVDDFIANGWEINTGLINKGISIYYNEMTPQESKEKAFKNLINGGRMSD